MVYQNLKFLQDSFLQTQNIFSWNLTTNMQLLFSNCLEQEFFFNLFSVSSCSSSILEHFSHTTTPFIASDRMGFVWIAVLQHNNEKEQIPIIHLLGPVFTSKMTEQYLNQHMHQMCLSSDMASRLWNHVRNVPAISSDIASRYASMMHFFVNNVSICPSEIEIWNETSQQTENVEWGANNWHGDWTAEQRFFKSISEGRIVDLNNITTGKIGNIGGGDPLRQAKNQLIIFAVLCSRAAIIGGVSVEGSLNLSDYFIQSAEAANSISTVDSLGMEMYHTYIQRVQKARTNKKYSPLIRACSEYVETHIFERIQLKDMATVIGYTEHYISRKFKQETGESLFNYINRQKTELAKSLLMNPSLSISELSERLGFASPSYFSSIFRKNTGMSPVEFLNQKTETADRS